MSFPPYNKSLHERVNKFVVLKDVRCMNNKYITKEYLKEMEYLEEELKYWITENELSRAEYKTIKIELLKKELDEVKMEYSKLCDTDNK